MKITKDELRRIIKEEISKLMSENEMSPEEKESAKPIIHDKFKYFHLLMFGDPQYDKAGEKGLVNALKRGTANDEAKALSLQSAVELRKVLRSYAEKDSQVAKAVEYLEKIMRDISEIDAEGVLRKGGTVAANFISQKFGYVWTALSRNGFLPTEYYLRQVVAEMSKQELTDIVKEELYLIQSGQDHESVFYEELATIEQKKMEMIQRFMDPTNLNKYNLRPGSEPGEVLDMDGNPFLRIMPAQKGYEVGFYSSGKSYLYDDLTALETGTSTTGTRFMGPPNLSDLAGTIPSGRFPSVTP